MQVKYSFSYFFSILKRTDLFLVLIFFLELCNDKLISLNHHLFFHLTAAPEGGEPSEPSATVLTKAKFSPPGKPGNSIFKFDL